MNDHAFKDGIFTTSSIPDPEHHTMATPMPQPSVEQELVSLRQQLAEAQGKSGSEPPDAEEAMTPNDMRERAERLYGQLAEPLAEHTKEMCIRLIGFALRQLRDDTLDEVARAMCPWCAVGDQPTTSGHVYVGLPCEAAPIHRLKGAAKT